MARPVLQTEMDKPVHQPIFEPWRVAALVLIVVAAMLVVHAIDPVSTGIPGRQALGTSTDR